MIVDVRFEDDSVEIAQVVGEESDMYVVYFLQKENNVYNFSLDPELVPKDAVSGFYDVEKLEDTGIYIKVPGGYDLVDDSEDEDFICTDEDEEESESESLVDEDEDEA